MRYMGGQSCEHYVGSFGNGKCAIDIWYRNPSFFSFSDGYIPRVERWLARLLLSPSG